MHAEFLEDIEEGRLEEHQVERYLNERVLDSAQREFLTKLGLSVVDVLNGRYQMSDREAILAWMTSVNARAGGKVFFPECC